MTKPLAERNRCWALLAEQKNSLDGHKRAFVHWVPADFRWEGSFAIALFRTRSDARKYADGRFGYIRNRPDLLAEPHCWRVPRPVRVDVSVREV